MSVLRRRRAVARKCGVMSGHGVPCPHVTAYFFSICSFRCFAQASAVVWRPWIVFFLSTA